MKRILLALPAYAALFATAAPAWACAVCGGDKNSDLVKGALSGVVVMVLITYGVLLGFAAMLVACFVRARRTSAARGDGPVGGDAPPP